MKDLLNRRTNPDVKHGPLGKDLQTTLWELAMKTEPGERRFNYLNAGEARCERVEQLKSKGYVEETHIIKGGQINISGDLTQKGIDYINEHIFRK